MAKQNGKNKKKAFDWLDAMTIGELDSEGWHINDHAYTAEEYLVLVLLTPQWYGKYSGKEKVLPGKGNTKSAYLDELAQKMSDASGTSWAPTGSVIGKKITLLKEKFREVQLWKDGTGNGVGGAEEIHLSGVDHNNEIRLKEKKATFRGMYRTCSAEFATWGAKSAYRPVNSSRFFPFFVFSDLIERKFKFYYDLEPIFGDCLAEPLATIEVGYDSEECLLPAHQSTHLILTKLQCAGRRGRRGDCDRGGTASRERRKPGRAAQSVRWVLIL